MKKYALRKKELNELLSKLNQLGYDDEPKQVFVIEDEISCLEIDGEVLFFYHEGDLVPTLKLLNRISLSIPAVVVDMGAIKFISKGADVMRPGIVEISDDIKKGSLVKVLDEKNRIAICVARALNDSGPMRQAKSGKSLKNIHYVGDKVWPMIS